MVKIYFTSILIKIIGMREALMKVGEGISPLFVDFLPYLSCFSDLMVKSKLITEYKAGNVRDYSFLSSHDSLYR